MLQLIHLLIYLVDVEININLMYLLLLIKIIQYNMVLVIDKLILLKIITLIRTRVMSHVCVMVLYNSWNKICKVEVLM